MLFKIRRARKADSAEFSKIFFKEFSKHDKAWTRKKSAARIKQALSLHPSWCFAILLGKEIIGFIVAEDFSFSKGRSVYIGDVAITAQHQRHGYGKKAMKFLLSEAKRRGRKSVYLNARPKDGALKLYKKLGFKPTGLIHMEKKL